MTDGDAPTPDDEPVAPMRADGPRTGFVLAVSAAVVFAGLAGVLAVLLVGQGGDEELDELRETAGRFGEALVTYDYRDPEAHRDTVLGFATGSFREQYEDAFDQGLGEVITQVEAVSVGHVKDIYLSAIDAEQAQAIVVVDIEHEGTGGSNDLFDVYFRLTMVEVGGEWKVDQVTDLNFDAGGGEGTTSPTASTSTSVP